MTGARKNRTLIAAAAAVIVVGVIVALATWHSGHHNNAASARPGHQAVGVITVAAKYLDLSPAQLRRELRSGRSLGEIANAAGDKSSAGLIDALVQSRAGSITAQETGGGVSASKAKARLAALRAAATARVERVPVAILTGRNMIAASHYLSLPAANIRARERAGQSLAQIADATSGRSAAGLIAALVHERTIAIDAFVKSGRLSSAQANARIATLPARVASAVAHAPRERSPLPAG